MEIQYFFFLTELPRIGLALGVLCCCYLKNKKKGALLEELVV